MIFALVFRTIHMMLAIFLEILFVSYYSHAFLRILVSKYEHPYESEGALINVDIHLCI
jgi:hypothetical protein